METTLTIDRPAYTEADVAELPWRLVELKVYTILTSVINSSDSNTPLSSAEELNLLAPTNRSTDGEGPIQAETSESFLWEFWGVVATVAGQVPVDHPGQERLVTLIKSLRDLPDPVQIHFGGGWTSAELWADLPLLGPVFREALDTDDGINLEAWIARLSRDGIIGFLWLGLVALHNALEKEPDPRSKKYQRQGRALDASVPRALMWLRIAGAKLYQACVVEEVIDGGYGSGGNWKGAAGFSKGRWEFWRKRFGEVAVHEQPTEETKTLAKQAVDIMAEIEVRVGVTGLSLTY